MRTQLVLACFAALLSGCSPGLVVHLYNATDETLTVSYPPYRVTDTIQPHTAADIGIAGDFIVSTPTRTWFYPQTGARPPVALFQQHTMLWRAFGRIDRRGRIYVLAPPVGEAAPREITQPAGFPLQPLAALTPVDLVAYLDAHAQIAKRLLQQCYDKRYTPSTFIEETAGGYQVGWFDDERKHLQHFAEFSQAAADYLLFSFGNAKPSSQSLEPNASRSAARMN